MIVKKSTAPLKGEVMIPGDKSISHRSIMFGAIAKGTTEVSNFLQGEDCLSTISCFQKMGVGIDNKGDRVIIRGNGLRGLKKPDGILDCGNSGTTTRLITGILAPQDFTVSLTGDASIQKRPMKRVIEPLSMMGADIKSLHDNGCAPLTITGRALTAVHYHSKVASAQVKSAILLAGLYAEGKTRVTEPFRSRNHTEIMLKYFGAEIEAAGTTAAVTQTRELHGNKVHVPGDISSAAYFIAAALLVPGSEVLLKNVGVNPTRDGLIKICQAMGGDITLLNLREEGELMADLLVRHSRLKGTEVAGGIIPTLIDELPVVALLGAMAEGTTIIRDAAELKVKESNRIEVMVKNLGAMGADITETDDGMIIHGGQPLKGAVIDSKLDHRIAMTFAIAALIADGETEIIGSHCADISYPGFFQDLERLSR